MLKGDDEVVYTEPGGIEWTRGEIMRVHLVGQCLDCGIPMFAYPEDKRHELCSHCRGGGDGDT